MEKVDMNYSFFSGKEPTDPAPAAASADGCRR